MNRNRILMALVITLVALNIGLIYIHFFKEERRNGSERLRSWLSSNLQLNKLQEERHISMRKKYFKDLGVLNDSLRHIKARFVSNASALDLTDSLSSMWTDSINHWHRRADVLTYQYIREVRAMLTSKQQPIWDSLMQVVMLGGSRE